MAKDSYVEYSKRRNPSASEDGWAKLKNWRDPMGNSGAPKDTATLPEVPAGKMRNKPGDSQA